MPFLLESSMNSIMQLKKGDCVIVKNNPLIDNLLYLGDWELGRQEAVYLKAKVNTPKDILYEIDQFFHKYQALDSWHIKISSNIPLHKDEVTNIAHYRYNIATKGDYIFLIEGNKYILTQGEAVLFRSDISEHGVELFSKNSVEIFSTGIFI